MFVCVGEKEKSFHREWKYPQIALQKMGSHFSFKHKHDIYQEEKLEGLSRTSENIS